MSNQGSVCPESIDCSTQEDTHGHSFTAGACPGGEGSQKVVDSVACSTDRMHDLHPERYSSASPETLAEDASHLDGLLPTTLHAAPEKSNTPPFSVDFVDVALPPRPLSPQQYGYSSGSRTDRKGEPQRAPQAQHTDAPAFSFRASPNLMGAPKVLNEKTGGTIPVPETIILVDTLSAFADFEAVCTDLLERASRRQNSLGLRAMKELATSEDLLKLLAASRQQENGPPIPVAVPGFTMEFTPPVGWDGEDEDFEVTVGLDLEGCQLGRGGRLCIVTFATATAVYVIDMVLLPKKVLSAFGATAFAKVLESSCVLKLMFDCRADCNALFFQYGVRLRGVCDLQVGAVMSLVGARARYLIGMEAAFSQLGLFHRGERTTKQEGRNLFNEKCGGRSQRWEERPLEPLLLLYCAVDVKHFFEAFYLLRSYTIFSLYWAEVRIHYVCQRRRNTYLEMDARIDFCFHNDHTTSLKYPAYRKR